MLENTLSRQSEDVDYLWKRQGPLRKSQHLEKNGQQTLRRRTDVTWKNQDLLRKNQELEEKGQRKDKVPGNYEGNSPNIARIANAVP